MRRGTLVIMSVAILVLAGMGGCSAAASLNRFEYTRLCMGVRTQIVLFAANETAAADAAAAAFDRIGSLDACMSDYRAGSELNRLAARAGHGPTRASVDLLEVIQSSQAISSASDGAFDITIGPLVRLWRKARHDGSPPDPSELSAARERVDWRRVVVDADARTIDCRMAGMELDLGGIGKGFAAQRAVDLLKQRGYSRCLVALAGDIAAGDAPPGRVGWRIETASGTLLISNAAVSTSGDSEQFIEIGGVRYSHIVDPRTGYGTTSRREVTVVARRGEIADGLSSALCVIEPSRAAELLQHFPGSAAIINTAPESNGGRIVIDPGHRLEWATQGAHP